MPQPGPWSPESWCHHVAVAAWRIAIVRPIEVAPAWLAKIERLSLAVDVVVSVVLAPVFENLLFRGLLFSASRGRWAMEGSDRPEPHC